MRDALQKVLGECLVVPRVQNSIVVEVFFYRADT